MAGRTLASMAAGGIHDQLAGGFARYGVDRAWVVPHFEKMLYDNGQLLSVYARWAAAQRRLGRGARWPAGSPTSCSPSWAPPRVPSPPRWTRTPRARRARSTSGRRRSWSTVLGPGGRRLGRRAADGHRARAPSRAARRPCSCAPSPRTGARWESCRRRLLAARSLRVRPDRDDKVVAAWNGLAISGLVDAGTLLGVPSYVEAAVRCGEFLASTHLVGRPAAAGLARRGRRVARRRPRGLRLRGHRASSRWPARPVTASGSTGPARCSTPCSTHFDAGDGGFHDTADDAEALMVRPRDPSDNASPSGHSSVVHALLSYAALTGSGPHRDAAERALLVSRQLADSSPRFAGWSLAAAETALGGPVEVAVVGPPGPTATPSSARPAGTPRVAPSWWRPRPGRARSRCCRPGPGRRPARGVRLPEPGLPAPGDLGRGPGRAPAGGLSRPIAAGTSRCWPPRSGR